MLERQELAWRVGFHQRVDSAPENGFRLRCRARCSWTVRQPKDGCLPVGRWYFPGSPTEENRRGPDAVLHLPCVTGASRLVLELSCPAFPQWNQAYPLEYRADYVPPTYGPQGRRGRNAWTQTGSGAAAWLAALRKRDCKLW